MASCLGKKKKKKHKKAIVLGNNQAVDGMLPMKIKNEIVENKQKRAAS